MNIYEKMRGSRCCMLVTENGYEIPVLVDNVDYFHHQPTKIECHEMYEVNTHRFVDDFRHRYFSRLGVRRPMFEPLVPKNPNVKKVIYNDPATIVIWDDGTKTVVKCQEGDEYNAELGLAMCISKKYLGNNGNFNEVFKKWVPEYSKVEKKFYFSKAWRILKEKLECSVCEGYELGYDKESDNDKKQNGMFYAYNHTLDLMKALEEV